MMMSETFWRNKMPSVKIRQITILQQPTLKKNILMQTPKRHRNIGASIGLCLDKECCCCCFFFWGGGGGTQRDPLTVRKLCPFLMPPMQADYFQWFSFLNDKWICPFFQRKKYRILRKLGKCQLEDQKFNTPADSPKIPRNFSNLQNF